jgi:hypothetical protein
MQLKAEYLDNYVNTKGVTIFKYKLSGDAKALEDFEKDEKEFNIREETGAPIFRRSIYGGKVTTIIKNESGTWFYPGEFSLIHRLEAIFKLNLFEILSIITKDRNWSLNYNPQFNNINFPVSSRESFEQLIKVLNIKYCYNSIKYDFALLDKVIDPTAL